MRHKFEGLDGLRGIAALAVVLFHRRSWFGGEAFLRHSYLAVDFFFLLSGFVLAHAYRERLREPGSLGGFLRDRVIRLHPLLVLGTVLGVVVVLGEVHAGRAELPRWPLATFLAAAVPWPTTWTGDPFLMNLPAWSLFWELVVNILFALTIAHLTVRRLSVVILASIAAMLAFGIVQGTFQLGHTNPTLAAGLPRVLASFSLGVGLLHLFHRGLRPALPVPGLVALALVATFAVPLLPGSMNALYDGAVAFLVYPAILLVAASQMPVFPRLARISGAVSYPLYILHEPMLRLLGAVLIVAGVSSGSSGPVEGVLRIAAVVLLSWLALRLFDEPVRRFLRRRFGARGHRSPPVAASRARPDAATGADQKR